MTSKFAVINVRYYSYVAALFETNFIILPSFFLCHVKAAVINKRAANNSYWNRANAGIWGRSP